jgi:hypothetical protein
MNPYGKNEHILWKIWAHFYLFSLIAHSLYSHTVSTYASDTCMYLVQNRVKRLKSAISYSPPFYSVLLVEQPQNMI